MAVETSDQARALADAANRAIESTLAIAQDEFELARLELVEKLPTLGRSALRLAVAALLIALGGALAVGALVWALADYVFGFEHVWASFAVIAAPLLLIGGWLANGALRRARAAGTPVPSAAIRHARALRGASRR